MSASMQVQFSCPDTGITSPKSYHDELVMYVCTDLTRRRCISPWEMLQMLCWKPLDQTDSYPAVYCFCPCYSYALCAHSLHSQSDAGSFSVPLHAYPPLPDIHCPTNVHLGTCALSGTLAQTIEVFNTGSAPGKFQIVWDTVAFNRVAGNAPADTSSINGSATVPASKPDSKGVEEPVVYTGVNTGAFITTSPAEGGFLCTRG